MNGKRKIAIDGGFNFSVHAKLSMQPVQRSILSEHEVKRCRAVARGNHWEVWEESIMWWSPDQQRWHPVEADVVPRHRRWLLLETEEGFRVALIWNAWDDAFMLPAPNRRYEPLPEQDRV